MPKQFKAIAAMALNRVIGRDNRLPWHLPEELKWFKQTTTGHVLVMGRKTFQSIGRPLPNRHTIVLTRGEFSHPGVQIAHSLGEIQTQMRDDPRNFFIIGGAQIFVEALPQCSDLYLTLVKREVEGDVFFPPFEHNFRLAGTVRQTAEFDILHYTRA